MKYAVAEIFHSIQGQGYWAGTPAVFVRLQGCDVGCPWCNEKNTWAAGAAIWSIDSILDAADSYGCNHVVLTGGEPLAQPIGPLIKALGRCFWRVQIETSGTEPLPRADAWITLAPKFGMARPMIVGTGMDEIKVMVGKPSDIEAAQPLILANPNAHVFLQPISESPKATEICVREAMKNNWRMSVSIHRMLGLQ